MITDAEDTFKRWTDFPGLVRKIFVRAPDSLATKSTHLWETLEYADEGHYAARVERAEANRGNRLTLERYDCFLILENPGGSVSGCAEG